MDQLLNIFFFVFHTVWTLFNMVGWIFPRTRKLHLITCLLTMLSWFVLGIWYGWGYCVCTDWHWQVRRNLGYQEESHSYIHFLILKLTGINMDPQLVDNITLVVFVVAVGMSVFLNIRDYMRKSRTKHA